MTGKIGILGGTFNPIHVGHIAMTRIAREEFALDRVMLIPAFLPPHKAETVDFEYRMELCRLAAAGEEYLFVSDIEAELGGISYTYQTLTELTRRHPEAEFYYIIGGDSLFGLGNWRHPEIIAGHAKIICIPRPGTETEAYARLAEEYHAEYGLEIRIAAESGPDISSTGIRAALAAGDDVRALLPEGVYEHVVR